jgi:hypothetical protein
MLTEKFFLARLRYTATLLPRQRKLDYCDEKYAILWPGDDILLGDWNLSIDFFLIGG